MNDKKLNEVKKVTDMAYVPVIMADGSVGQIAKADLATVVAEVGRFTNRDDDVDLDNLVPYKWYLVGVDNANKPSNTSNELAFVRTEFVGTYSQQFYIQTYIGWTPGSRYIRLKTDIGWMPWSQF